MRAPERSQDRPGVLAARRAWSRPWVAIGIAAIAFGATLLLLLVARRSPGWPSPEGVGGALLDIVLVLAPLALAVVAAAVVAGAERRVGPATGLRPWRWLDVLAGLAVGLALRAVVELFVPTTGTLGGPFGTVTAAVVVAAIASVVLAPLIEELYFRGLVQRALGDALAAGRLLAGAVAILISTAAFVLLHMASYAGATLGQIVAWALVGLGCGILTLFTGRLGGAIAAHLVYNALGVALLLW
ncbi:CPBP family intramembrane glutamic endopeptidase [Microbacterium kyungheense]|uniref:CAAX prenyl protease-like protein n=1 Tax=Microbacterium kyungheense TaxID=1263636 RepID=A0A543FK79_9MICO|nr:CPBP family intramembrane glutamic endopeptidase [Microbacterium kyungheense]TQM34104.1 CAAX prenyl protease-like protein [Microbacterium kyungheense]